MEVLAGEACQNFHFFKKKIVYLLTFAKVIR
jgi:hypothetical protein